MIKNIKILYIGNNLFAKTNYSTSYDILSDNLFNEGFTIIKKSSKSSKILRLLDMCFSVLLFRNKVDYVIIDTYSTNNFYFALLTSQLCRVFKLKYIPILHGGNLPNRIKNYPNLSSLIFKFSYKNISPSAYLKYEFEKEGFKSLLINNIIPIDEYKFKKRNIIKPRLLYVRAFAEIYNPTMAVEVLKELKKTHKDAVLCMIGPDRDGILKEVQQMILDYNLDDSVEITGVLSKKEWHKKSESYDIFINTTNVDNTPISVIEAMALGIPVVSTNVGGLSYLIDDKKDGFLVNRGDICSMKNTIINVIENYSIKVTENARKKVEFFDWKVIRNKWIEILK